MSKSIQQLKVMRTHPREKRNGEVELEQREHDWQQEELERELGVGQEEQEQENRCVVPDRSILPSLPC